MQSHWPCDQRLRGIKGGGVGFIFSFQLSIGSAIWQNRVQIKMYSFQFPSTSQFSYKFIQAVTANTQKPIFKSSQKTSLDRFSANPGGRTGRRTCRALSTNWPSLLKTCQRIDPPYELCVNELTVRSINCVNEFVRLVSTNGCLRICVSTNWCVDEFACQRIDSYSCQPTGS